MSVHVMAFLRREYRPPAPPFVSRETVSLTGLCCSGREQNIPALQYLHCAARKHRLTKGSLGWQVGLPHTQLPSVARHCKGAWRAHVGAPPPSPSCTMSALQALHSSGPQDSNACTHSSGYVSLPGQQRWESFTRLFECVYIT